MDYMDGLFTGFLFSAVTVIGLYLISPPKISSARILPSRQGTSVMRVYKQGIGGTLIRSSTDSSRYISISDYLNHNFPDKNERNLERARIELLVSQEEAK